MNDKEITLTLTLNDANLILAALGKLPFEAVADLVGKIKEQSQPFHLWAGDFPRRWLGLRRYSWPCCRSPDRRCQGNLRPCLR